MKFLRMLVISLLAFTLAACNFSLAEDITPPPGAGLSPNPTAVLPTPEIATPAASTPSGATTSASPVPAGDQTGVPAASVSISGKVTNGSGASLPTGLNVILHGILNQQETLNLNQPLNPDGSYSFENVKLTNGMEVIAVVQYGPVSFLSAGVVFDGTQSSYDQPVTIYDSTSELSGLNLDQVHVQASFSTAGQIQLNEIYVINNPGKSAVTVVTDGTSLPFAKLPDGALQPSIDLSQGSAPLVMADNGFAMLPGGQQYAFVLTFALPYTANKASLSQPFVLPPASVTVIVPAGVKVAGAGLADQGTNDFQGSSFQIYSGGPLKAGTALALNVSGSPQTAPAASGSTGTFPALQLGLGLAGLLLVAGGVVFYVRDRRKIKAAGQAEMLEPGDLDDETARLADAILALDDRFASGDIDREAYQQQRLELKEKLAGRL